MGGIISNMMLGNNQHNIHNEMHYVDDVSFHTGDIKTNNMTATNNISKNQRFDENSPPITDLVKTRTNLINKFDAGVTTPNN